MLFTKYFLLDCLLRVPGAILALSASGFGLAYITRKFSNSPHKTDEKQSFSPSPYIDPIGFLMLLISGLGWGNPLNNNNSKSFKNPIRTQLFVIAFAAIMNLLVATLFAIPRVIMAEVLDPNLIQFNTVVYNIARALELGFDTNVYFAVFGLLPLPLLPGYSVLHLMVSDKEKYRSFIDKFQKNGTTILLILIVTLTISGIVMQTFGLTSPIHTFFNDLISGSVRFIYLKLVG